MLSEKMLFRLCKNAAPLCIAFSIALYSPSLLHSAEERSYAREIKQYVAEDKVYLLENIQENITRPSEKTVAEALLCESGPQAIELFQKQLKEYPDPALDQLSKSRIAAYSLALDSTAPLPKLSSPLPSPKSQNAGVQESTKPHIASIPNKPKQAISPLPLPLAVREKLEAAPPPSTAPVKPKQEANHPASPASVKPKLEVNPPVPPASVKPKQEAAIARSSGFTLQFGLFANKENAVALSKKLSLYEPVEIIEHRNSYRIILKKSYVTKQEAEAMLKKLPFIAIIVPANEVQR